MAGTVHRYHRFGGRGYRQRVCVERAQQLEQYTTEELYDRFRFGNADIEYIADLVRPNLQRRTRRSHSLSVEVQVLIGLPFYASGTFYQVVGDNIGVDKSTVNDVVKAVSIALASLVNQFVSLPKDVQIAQTKHKFFLLGNMPNTIGVIDCTHVHIQAPHERDWEYINRKGRRSINIQLVCDADLIITNCVVKWPGLIRQMRNTVKAHIDDQKKLELKLAELKDRSRINNVRIIGLKEGSEKDDPVGFLQNQLPKWIPSLRNRATIEIDRAHRIYGKGATTRTLIDSNATLRIKPDYSAFTVQRCQEFIGVQIRLHAKDIPNFLIYPASLRVNHRGRTLTFTAPEEADRLCPDLDMEEGDVAPARGASRPDQELSSGPEGGVEASCPVFAEL
ncbi:putative nuclease HARBI1 [Perca fluviatilis]|uniref:putative nuclease HARBI1 n=1 Tax=Perca fluviatilis TaxID=8168 RepID=UPI00196500F6|nr:putative nuclease HARBI1 [Perca fluviatilis]